MTAEGFPNSGHWLVLTTEAPVKYPLGLLTTTASSIMNKKPAFYIFSTTGNQDPNQSV